jgi:hypothetical protein
MALISGAVFKDTNRNGKQDGGEAALAGWVVFLDTNNNGKLDAGELSLTTGADGKFRLSSKRGLITCAKCSRAGSLAPRLLLACTRLR